MKSLLPLLHVCIALWENDGNVLPREGTFVLLVALPDSITTVAIFSVPNDLCGLMPKCDHLCFVISRLGYQILTDSGAFSFTIIMGVGSGLLTGQCETTLLPPLSRAQGLGLD